MFWAKICLISQHPYYLFEMLRFTKGKAKREGQFIVTKWRLWWHRTGSVLVHVMVYGLVAPDHFLDQCWLIISNILWHSSEAISQEILKTSILNMSLRFTNLKLQLHLPRVNELFICGWLNPRDRSGNKICNKFPSPNQWSLSNPDSSYIYVCLCLYGDRTRKIIRGNYFADENFPTQFISVVIVRRNTCH